MQVLALAEKCQKTGKGGPGSVQENVALHAVSVAEELSLFGRSELANLGGARRNAQTLARYKTVKQNLFQMLVV